MSESSTIIKAAAEQDLDLLLPFVRSYHDFEGLDIVESERRAAVSGLLNNTHLGGIWIIFDGAEPCGYMAVCKGYSIEFGGFDAFIDEFFIRPESRGRGIGGAVLQLIKVEARKLGVRALHLEVARSNSQARNLYESNAFVARDGYTLMSVELD